MWGEYHGYFERNVPASDVLVDTEDVKLSDLVGIMKKRHKFYKQGSPEQRTLYFTYVDLCRMVFHATLNSDFNDLCNESTFEEEHWFTNVFTPRDEAFILLIFICYCHDWYTEFQIDHDLRGWTPSASTASVVTSATESTGSSSAGTQNDGDDDGNDSDDGDERSSGTGQKQAAAKKSKKMPEEEAKDAEKARRKNAAKSGGASDSSSKATRRSLIDKESQKMLDDYTKKIADACKALSVSKNREDHNGKWQNAIRDYQREKWPLQKPVEQSEAHGNVANDNGEEHHQGGDDGTDSSLVQKDGYDAGPYLDDDGEDDEMYMANAYAY